MMKYELGNRYHGKPPDTSMERPMYIYGSNIKILDHPACRSGPGWIWSQRIAEWIVYQPESTLEPSEESSKKDGIHFMICSNTHDGSMVLVYMLTWLGYIDGIHVAIYSIHGSYGLCFSDWCKQKTPSLVLRLSGHCMEWRSGHVWTKFHIAWWKAVLGHGYALRLCQQWRQREGLTAFDSWNPGFSRVLTSSECQRYLCKAACTMLKCFNIPHTVFFV